jgi:hypothetical protein
LVAIDEGLVPDLLFATVGEAYPQTLKDRSAAFSGEILLRYPLSGKGLPGDKEK